MASTDPIADVLTKLRNASRAKHPSVDVLAFKFAERLLEVLKKEGFIRSYKVVGSVIPKRCIRVYLKYADHKSVITQIVRISKPGLRVYRNADQLPRVLGGLGIAVVTTSRGLMTEREAFHQRIGGEVICHVW